MEYLPLYNAALKGDWTSARRFFDHDPDAVTARITSQLETTIHVAVGTGNNVHFVKELLELMPAEALELPNLLGNTALMYAALVGNTKAAEMLVRKNPNLTQQLHDQWRTPLHTSAEYGHKETTKYLLSVTRDNDPSPFRGQSGILLLRYVILAGFYDMALDLVQCYPDMAATKDKYEIPLHTLSKMRFAFPSGAQLSFWQRPIYKCVPIKLNNEPLFPIRSDMENLTQSSRESMQMSNWSRFVKGIQISSVCQTLNIAIWDAIKLLVPGVKQIQDKKLTHLQVLQLVKSICAEIVRLKNLDVWYLVQEPKFNTARNGIHESIIEIFQACPSAIWSVDGELHSMFHLAVLNRRVKVFNLVYQMSSFKHFLLAIIDKSDNNILHMAAKLAPSPQLSSVSGAALQMQRELQWYKEVEKFVKPSFIEMLNSEMKTPKMVFTEEHMDLVKEGEK